MPRNKSISELGYFQLPELKDPNHWSLRLSTRFLELFWLGVEKFKNDAKSMHFNFSGDAEQIERDLTQMIERRIHRVMTGDEPFDVQHETHELSTRKTASSKPRQYDIAFIMHDNELLIFPFEAKLLPTDRNVSRYVHDINELFLKCIYAPFSYEGAMIGYLLSGTVSNAFNSISAALNKTLNIHPNFPNYPQRYSDHSRNVPKEKVLEYPEEFRCHHLILDFGTLNSTEK